MSDETDWRAQGYALPPNEFSPEPEKPVPTGLQKLPRTWAYLTRGARPPEPTVDAFDNPLESPAAEVKPSRGQTENRESAFSGDWPTGDGDADASAVDPDAFDAADVLNTLPPDVNLTHEGEAIVASLAEHMHPHGMSPSQVHESLRWLNGFDSSESDDTAIFENFAMHMSKHGMSRSQVDQVKVWADSYLASEDYKDDMAEAAVDEAIERIQGKMGSQEYIKSEKMQEAYRILLDVRDGDGEA